MAVLILPVSCCRTFGVVGDKAITLLFPTLTISLNSGGDLTVPYPDYGSEYPSGCTFFSLFQVVPVGLLSLAVEDEKVFKLAHDRPLES